MNILGKVKRDGLIFDGATGSMLISKGLAIGETPELWNLKHPDILRDIHRSYYDAGAGVAAVGANCSIGSDTMVALAAEIRKSVDIPIIIQPNAGMPEKFS